jgi:hypothetical protein
MPRFVGFFWFESVLAGYCVVEILLSAYAQSGPFPDPMPSIVRPTSEVLESLTAF